MLLICKIYITQRSRGSLCRYTTSQLDSNQLIPLIVAVLPIKLLMDYWSYLKEIKVDILYGQSNSNRHIMWKMICLPVNINFGSWIFFCFTQLYVAFFASLESYPLKKKRWFLDRNEQINGEERSGKKPQRIYCIYTIMGATIKRKLTLQISYSRLITRALRLELRIRNLKFPIFPIKLYSYFV